MCMSRPARVVAIFDDATTAVVETGGGQREVSLVVLAHEGVSVRPGDWVLLGSGLAVARIDEREAVEMLALHEEARRAP